MTEKPPHPMVPFLTGMLTGSALRDLGPVKVTARPPDRFDVTLASGVVLRVTVEEVAEREARRE